MSALSKLSTMNRPLGAVVGAVGGGASVGVGAGAGFAGAVGGGATASGGRGPTETGGMVGSVWIVTVGGGGTGPSGGVAILGACLPFAVQPATSESTRVLAMTPLSLLLRSIGHSRRQTAQQIRGKRSSPRKLRRRRRYDRGLSGNHGRRRLTWYDDGRHLAGLHDRRLRGLRHLRGRRRRGRNDAGQSRG